MAGPTPLPAQPGPAQQVQGSQDAHDEVRRTAHPKLEALSGVMGYPVIAYFLDEGAGLADEQMEHLYEHLRRLGKVERRGLWIQSRGGATEIPWKVVSLLREYSKWFAVLAPYRAHSAATHIALGADEIVLTEMSELGSVDPSRRHPLLPKEEGVAGKAAPIPISVQDLRHVLEFVKREMGEDLGPDAAARVYTALFDKVHPLAIGAMEQSWALSNQVTESVLSTHMDTAKDREKIEEIVKRLSEHYKSHVYPISRREAREMGLKTRDASDQEAEAMWDLYLAYRSLKIEGQGEINGKPATVGRLGHIDSPAGTTLGVTIVSVADPTQSISSWESRWTTAPAPAGAPTP